MTQSPNGVRSSFEAVPVKNRPVRKQEYNKRHALLAATQQRDPTTGHQWAVASSAKNLTVKCQDCGLYAQQTDPVDTVKFVLQHPCRGRAAAPGTDSGVHSSHRIVNLGRLWSCSLCNANYSVRTPAKGRLARECQGASRTSSGRRKSETAATTKAQGSAEPAARTKAQGFSLLFAGGQPTQPTQSAGLGFFPSTPSNVQSLLQGASPGPCSPCAVSSLGSKTPRAREVLLEAPAVKGPDIFETAQTPAKSSSTAPPGSEATPARAPQPAGQGDAALNTAVSSGAGKTTTPKPKPKAKKHKDTSSTPSVLQFFRKQG